MLYCVERPARTLNVHRDSLYAWAKPIADDEQVDPEIAELREQVAWLLEVLSLERADKLQQGGLQKYCHPAVTKMLLSRMGYAEMTRAGPEPQARR